MFLLFRNFSSFKSPTNTHLHSNMFLLFRATAASSLAAFNSFTFQYVSIISICLFINIFQCFRFTFQYVSIIFGIIAIEKICEIHLHSNMFLLFPVIATAVIATAVIFTFQYVSIISAVPCKSVFTCA